MLPDPDKMSFLEHLDELRTRLIHVVAALAVAFVVCWGFRDPIFHFLTQPLRQSHPDIKFIFTGPSEALTLKMKMAFFVGIFVAAPYILYQVWAFVSPGLYPHEKRYAWPFIAAGTFFFLGGAAFGHFYLFPITFAFLIDFGGLDMQFLPKVGEYYEFYSWFLLGLGVVFQLPVVIFVLARIGLVTPGFLLRKFKYAVRDLVRGGRHHHAHARHRDPDAAGGAHARAVSARGGGGLAVRQAAAADRGTVSAEA